MRERPGRLLVEASFSLSDVSPKKEQHMSPVGQKATGYLKNKTLLDLKNLGLVRENESSNICLPVSSYRLTCSFPLGGPAKRSQAPRALPRAK